MRKAWLLITGCLFTLVGFTQTGTISGRLKDNSEKAIAGATASLLKAVDSVQIKTTVTDNDGVFRFSGLPKGKYLVALTNAGFKKKISAVVDLDNDGSVQELGTIKLTEDAKDLQTVNVTSKRPFMEQKLDKMIINVDAAVTNAGSNILEVLEKSPGVTIDKDGNISLKGKQQVLIMIDGRPTYLGPTELASLLKSMPAEEAEKFRSMLANP